MNSSLVACGIICLEYLNLKWVVFLMKEENLTIDDELESSEIEEEKEEVSPLDEIGDIKEAFIVSADWTIETIYSQIKKSNIDLNPSFQRRDVWSNAKKSRLIESILLRVPIPQIILAEKKDSPRKFLVLDGKQRLLTIKQFMNGDLKLSNLLVLTQYNGKKVTDIFGEDLSEFENETLRAIFIRNWPSTSYLYAVFNRLNTGSTPLSAQELRISLFPGPFTQFLTEKSSDPLILKLLNLKKPDSRMRDVELLLRYFAFKNFSDKYTGKLKIFFDQTIDKLNVFWHENKEALIRGQFEEFISSINFVNDIFDEKSFTRLDTEESKRKFIKPIYDFLTYYFSDTEVRNAVTSIEDYKNKLISNYAQLFQNVQFNQHLTSHTSDLVATKYRFKEFEKVLNNLFEENALNLRVKSPFGE